MMYTPPVLDERFEARAYVFPAYYAFGVYTRTENILAALAIIRHLSVGWCLAGGWN